jgi:hypothetical protein
MLTSLISLPARWLSFRLRPKNLPYLPSFRHWRSVAHFGIGSLLSSCVNALNNAIPDILLGKLGTARHVGLLSRANSTVTIFTYVAGSTVSYGAVTYLAQTHHRGESLVPVLSRATLLLTGVGWTALALTSVLGQDIVLALYGPKWLECVPAILPLSLAAAVAMMFHYIPMAVTAIGRPYLSAVPVHYPADADRAWRAAVRRQRGGFAWALCLATIVAAPVTAAQQQRHFGFKIGVMLRAMAPSAVVASVPRRPPHAGAGSAFGAGALVRLLVMAPLLAAVWYLLLRATRHELVDEVHRLAAPIGPGWRIASECIMHRRRRHGRSHLPMRMKICTSTK